MSKDKSLPSRPVVGDKIRLRPERMAAYKLAADLAGYSFDPYAIREVVRIDPHAAGGGNRLWVQGEPHMFLPRDVQLAWNTDGERAEMLKARGWTYVKNNKEERWVEP
jgi:hypothetical protein